MTIVDQTLFSSGQFRWWDLLPNIAADFDDNLHVVWLEESGTQAIEIFYQMLDGNTDVLIDTTALTTDDGFYENYPSLAVDPGNEVTIVFEDDRFWGEGAAMYLL